MATRSFLGGLAVGAGLAYYLDPERGAERRHLVGLRLDGWRGIGHTRRAPARYGSRRDDVAGLEAANLASAGQAWTPSTALALLAGGVLAWYGLTRRGLTGAAARTLGAGLIARGWRPLPEQAAAERRRVVDIQQSIHIDAPVAEVYAFWDSYESYPLFLSAVR